MSAPEIPERAPIATRTEALNQINPTLISALHRPPYGSDRRLAAFRKRYLELLLGAARVLEATALVLLQTPAEAIRHARATVLVLRMARAGAGARWRRSGRRAGRGPVRTKTSSARSSEETRPSLGKKCSGDHRRLLPVTTLLCSLRSQSSPTQPGAHSSQSSPIQPSKQPCSFTPPDGGGGGGGGADWPGCSSTVPSLVRNNVAQ